MKMSGGCTNVSASNSEVVKGETNGDKSLSSTEPNLTKLSRTSDLTYGSGQEVLPETLVDVCC